jgi:hypothetical protein
MNKTKKIICSFIIYAIIISFIYYFKIGGDKFPLIEDIITFTPLICLFFGYKAIRYFGLKTKQGKSALFITLGIGLWFLADVLWMILFDGAVISIADIFYLLPYILIPIGISLGALTINPEFFKDTKKIVIMIILEILLILFFFKVLTIPWSNDIGFIENLVTSGYVIGDLMLLISLSFLLFSILSGKFKLPWIMIAIGTLINFLGDIFYAINYNNYNSGDLIDVSWIIAYLFFGLGLYLLKNTAENALTSFKEKLSIKK